MYSIRCFQKKSQTIVFVRLILERFSNEKEDPLSILFPVKETIKCPLLVVI